MWFELASPSQPDLDIGVEGQELAFRTTRKDLPESEVLFSLRVCALIPKQWFS